MHRARNAPASQPPVIVSVRLDMCFVLGIASSSPLSTSDCPSPPTRFYHSHDGFMACASHTPAHPVIITVTVDVLYAIRSDHKRPPIASTCATTSINTKPTRGILKPTPPLSTSLHFTHALSLSLPASTLTFEHTHVASANRPSPPPLLIHFTTKSIFAQNQLTYCIVCVGVCVYPSHVSPFTSGCSIHVRVNCYLRTLPHPKRPTPSNH